MEPVFMILGQSAATAAVIAIEKKLAVQDVPYGELRERLKADGQVLEYASADGGKASPAVPPMPVNRLAGIVVDDEQAELEGEWVTSHAGTAIGSGYRHDGNHRDGSRAAKFSFEVAEEGRYEVRLAYAANPNRATNVQVRVEHAEGTTERMVDQRKAPDVEGRFVSLGVFRFEKGRKGSVRITNRGADGYVIADAIQVIQPK
jgi:hypothetical protein